MCRALACLVESLSLLSEAPARRVSDGLRPAPQRAPWWRRGGDADLSHGPFTLGPGGETMGTPSSGMPRPAGSFGLQGATFDVVDQNGTPVSAHDVHLHHIVMTTSAHQDALCPQRRERFTVSGMERTPINLWGPYVHPVGAGDNWGSIYHLMNETQTTRTVHIQYTLRYQPGANATNSRPVQPWFMDVTGCGNSTYDVPGNGGPGSVQVGRHARGRRRAQGWRCSQADTCTTAASTSRSGTQPLTRRPAP